MPPAAPAPEAPAPPPEEDPKKMMGGMGGQEHAPPNYPDKSKHYAALDEMGDDDFEEYSRHRAGKKNYGANETGEYQTADQAEGMAGSDHKHEIGAHHTGDAGAKQYEAGSVENGNAHKPASGTVEPDNAGPSGQGSVSDIPGEADGSYKASSGAPSRYAKTAADRGLVDEVSKLRYQLGIEQAHRINAERLGKLQFLHHQGYGIDPDEQMKVCKYGKDGMTDEQFAERMNFIAESVARAPLDLTIPHTDGPVFAPNAPGSASQRENYNKSASDEARRICEEKALRGETPNYQEVLATCRNGTG